MQSYGGVGLSVDWKKPYLYFPPTSLEKDGVGPRGATVFSPFFLIGKVVES